KYGSEIKMDLMENWRDQMVAQVRGERNHPSVMVWSLENEYLYINCINLHRDHLPEFEREVTLTSEAVRAVDPTRFTMVDGGGATKENTLPVHGDHYVFGGFPRYPDLAYEANPEAGGRGYWQWDQRRPRFIGEDFFASGFNPFDYSYFGGEETFVGRAQSRRAVGLIFRMLTEGYRWAGYGAWQFWMGQESAIDQYGSNAPRAVLCRQWNWTFGSGEKVRRTLRIFNDTRRGDPITLRWQLVIGSEKVAEASGIYALAPGASTSPFDVELPMPAVEDREEGEWILALEVKGEEVFRDVKKVSVIQADVDPKRYPHLAELGREELAVLDPRGDVRRWLESQSVPFSELESVDSIPPPVRVLVAGNEAIDAAGAGSSALKAWAATGGRAIVLEQREPLRYQALMADLEPDANEGRTAFAEDLSHPVLRGLEQKDFFTWGPDHIVYRNAYGKPTRGAKSLVQCHERLERTALAESAVGEGLMLLCQLAVGEKLATQAIAQRLMGQMIEHAASYRREIRPVAVCAEGHPVLERELDAIGLEHSSRKDPLSTLDPRQNLIAVIHASPEHLSLLAAHLPRVEAFTAAGGWLVLIGLTPEGLADYNRIVGFDHMIRPFRRERVTFPPRRDPLASGLTTGDVVMQSGERIFTWTRDVFLASDVFTYAVDIDDVAPFAELPGHEYFGYAPDDGGNDHDPLNMVNGFVSSDSWKYIFSIPLSKGAPTDFTVELPREQELRELEWTGNGFYHLITEVALTFDGDESRPLVLATAPSDQPQSFAIDPPRRARKIRLDIRKWDRVGKVDVIGIDNVRLLAVRPERFRETVKPLLNIGALVRYDRGAGGILLSQILHQERESVSINQEKKRKILATLLRNLKAPFAAERMVLAGVKLRYHPIDLAPNCNQYRGERGWFGEQKLTFEDMPAGRQRFAGVDYLLHEMRTSPTPDCIMLRGPRVPGSLPDEVRGIRVGRRADALFFLHACRVDRGLDSRERREGEEVEIFKYVVHYADGSTAEIPNRLEIDIGDYRQESPQVIPGAELAWSAPWPGTDQASAAYSKQWTNPRPDVVIESVDLLYGKDRRGVPALLALTAAEVME
ncbi:MAG: hypothetical protein JXA90_14215, partial [Planctomycetes bacterium]|nr:hypothetical protein [Planctomycetota bacterium]